MTVPLSTREVAIFFERSPIGLAIVALDGRFIRVNHSLTLLLGYSESEMLTRTWMSITHPDDLNIEIAERASLINTDKLNCSLEKRYIAKSGYAVAVRIYIEVVKDDSGNPTHFATQMEALSNGRSRLERQSDGTVTARPVIKIGEFFRDNWKTLIPIIGTLLTSIFIPIGILYMNYLETKAENTEIIRELRKANDLNFTLIQNTVQELRRREAPKER